MSTKTVAISGFYDRALDPDALEPEVDITAVTLALADGRWPVRLNAARWFGRFADTLSPIAQASARDWLAPLTRDPDTRVRVAALRAVAALFAPSLLPRLVAALADRDPEAREAALAALVRSGPTSFVPALALLPTGPTQAPIADALRTLATRFGPAVAPALADALSTTPSPLPAAALALAALALGDLGAAAEDAAPALVRALTSPVPDLRAAAARALGFLAPVLDSDPTILSELASLRTDTSSRVRRQAALAAARLTGRPLDDRRPKDVIAVPIPGFETAPLPPDALATLPPDLTPELVAHALSDGRLLVRQNAARLARAVALTYPDHPATPLLHPLARLLRDPDPSARTLALDACTALGRRTLPVAWALTAALADPLLHAPLLPLLASLTPDIFPFLIEALRTDPAAAPTTILPLFKHLGSDAVPPLAAALSAASPLIRQNAAHALELLAADGAAYARAELAARHTDPVASVRSAALTALTALDAPPPPPPQVLDPTPLPLPNFADAPLSHDALAARAETLRLDLLAHALTDGRVIVRQNAATALAVLGTGAELARPLLIRALRDSDTEVRVRATHALAALPPRRDTAFDLVALLDDPSPRVVDAAEATLRAFGPFALDAYLFALDAPPALAGRTILPLLGDLGDKAVDAFIVAQGHASPSVRQNALIGLRLLDRALAQGARAAVTAATLDAARDVRLEARRTLDWLDDRVTSLVRDPLPLPSPAFAERSLTPPELSPLLPAFPVASLIPLLHDGRRYVRENAARALGLAHHFDPALPLLLRDSFPPARHAALAALAALGPAAVSAAPALIDALATPDPTLVASAREALTALGPLALPALLDALRAAPDTASKALIPILKSLGTSATSHIIAALDHPSVLVVINALATLAELYDVDPTSASALPRVRTFFHHPVPALADQAQRTAFRLEGRTPAAALREPTLLPLPGFDAAPLPADALRAAAATVDPARLVAALTDGRPLVRENAARISGYFPNNLATLLQSLILTLKDSVPEVQVAAADALALLPAAAPVAIPALTQALRDATDRVTRACFVALDAFGPAQVTEALLPLLGGREDWALQTIGKVAQRIDEVLIPALAAFALDATHRLDARENAVRIIASLGQKARGVERELARLLPSSEGMLAAKAAFALAATARPDPELISLLEAHLTTERRPSVLLELRAALKTIKRRRPPQPKK